MTDRIASVTVVFATDMRDDDAQYVIAAIEQLKGVLEVRPEVVGAEHVVAKAQARGELLTRIQQAMADYV